MFVTPTDDVAYYIPTDTGIYYFYIFYFYLLPLTADTNSFITPKKTIIDKKVFCMWLYVCMVTFTEILVA